MQHLSSMKDSISHNYPDSSPFYSHCQSIEEECFGDSIKGVQNLLKSYERSLEETTQPKTQDFQNQCINGDSPQNLNSKNASYLLSFIDDYHRKFKPLDHSILLNHHSNFQEINMPASSSRFPVKLSSAKERYLKFKRRQNRMSKKSPINLQGVSALIDKNLQSGANQKNIHQILSSENQFNNNVKKIMLPSNSKLPSISFSGSPLNSGRRANPRLKEISPPRILPGPSNISPLGNNNRKEVNKSIDLRFDSMDKDGEVLQLNSPLESKEVELPKIRNISLVEDDYSAIFGEPSSNNEGKNIEVSVFKHNNSISSHPYRRFRSNPRTSNLFKLPELQFQNSKTRVSEKKDMNVSPYSKKSNSASISSHKNEIRKYLQAINKVFRASDESPTARARKRFSPKKNSIPPNIHTQEPLTSKVKEEILQDLQAMKNSPKQLVKNENNTSTTSLDITSQSPAYNTNTSLDQPISSRADFLSSKRIKKTKLLQTSKVTPELHVPIHSSPPTKIATLLQKNKESFRVNTQNLLRQNNNKSSKSRIIGKVPSSSKLNKKFSITKFEVENAIVQKKMTDDDYFLLIAQKQKLEERNNGRPFCQSPNELCHYEALEREENTISNHSLSVSHQAGSSLNKLTPRYSPKKHSLSFLNQQYSSLLEKEGIQDKIAELRKKWKEQKDVSCGNSKEDLKDRKTVFQKKIEMNRLVLNSMDARIPNANVNINLLHEDGRKETFQCQLSGPKNKKKNHKKVHIDRTEWNLSPWRNTPFHNYIEDMGIPDPSLHHS